MIDDMLREQGAALKVQTKFRTHNAPSIRELRLKLIDERIQKRYKEEQKRRETSVEERLQTFYEEMRHDSASEDEEEEWEEIYNTDLQRFVYYNKVLNEQRDTNPLERLFERALVGLRIKVRYPVKYIRRSQVHDMTAFEYGDFDLDTSGEKEPERWYVGEVREYNATKDKHKVVFTAPLGQDRPPNIVYQREWIILGDDPTRTAFEIPSIDNPNEKVWVMYNQMDNDRDRMTKIIAGEAYEEERKAIQEAFQKYEAHKHAGFDKEQLDLVIQDYENNENYAYDSGTHADWNTDVPRQTEDAPESIEEYENQFTQSQNWADPESNEWEAFQDEHGNEYYYNHTTGMSSWENPWE